MVQGEAEKVENLIFSFFIESSDFNGIPLRDISSKLGLSYEYSIDLVKDLVSKDVVSIQSSSNPHIIGFAHHPIDSQLQVLEHAKSIKASNRKIDNIEFIMEETEYPICVYPTKRILKSKRDLSKYGYAKYLVDLALGEPQLSFRFFEIDVLERYANDPRFDFEFHDFYGSISCKYDESGNAILREEDQILLKSFGLGFDSNSNRVIAVLLRYLGDLSAEHQVYWGTREIPVSECKVLSDYYENIIEGSWIASRSVFSAFIDEINAIYKLTHSIFGIPMFREELIGDQRPRNFTFFFSPTSKNYYDFINLLDKYISENINKDFFKEEVELEELKPIGENKYERVQKGTLRILEEWLSKVFKYNDQNFPKEIVKPFKDVRNERQKPAHKVIDNQYDILYIDKQKKMIENCYVSMGSIRRNIATHPQAAFVELPDFIDSENIKYF